MNEALSLRVAEALGWTDIQHIGGLMTPAASHHDGVPPSERYIVGEKRRQKVPRFDLEWETTGPLFERFRIELWRDRDRWCAVSPYPDDKTAPYGDTALEAVCELLIALGAAGRLTP